MLKSKSSERNCSPLVIFFVCLEHRATDCVSTLILDAYSIFTNKSTTYMDSVFLGYSVDLRPCANLHSYPYIWTTTFFEPLRCYVCFYTYVNSKIAFSQCKTMLSVPTSVASPAKPQLRLSSM